jgi:hypothetical protein
MKYTLLHKSGLVDLCECSPSPRSLILYLKYLIEGSLFRRCFVLVESSLLAIIWYRFSELASAQYLRYVQRLADTGQIMTMKPIRQNNGTISAHDSSNNEHLRWKRLCNDV